MDLGIFKEVQGNSTKYNNDSSTTFTPMHIAEEMVSLLPDNIWNPDTTFIDISCKTGAFLIAAFNKLDYALSSLPEYRDKKVRRNHILNKQLYGLSLDDLDTLYFSRRNVYGDMMHPNIKYLGSSNHSYSSIVHTGKIKQIKEIIQEEFGNMEFNVVLGNPPYNRGGDIDFVNLGFELATDYTLMITPAKWQTAEADQKILSKMTYGQFREKLVPHMSHVVFYPDCLDVFGIQEASGISYYILDKHKYSKLCTVINKSNLQKYANGNSFRSIYNGESLWNIGDEIVTFLGNYEKFKFSDIETKGKYTVNINKQAYVSTGTSGVWDWDNSMIKPECVGKGGVLFKQDGSISLLGNPKIIGDGDKSASATSKNIFNSESLDACKSFVSWIDSKFNRFLILVTMSSLSIINDNTFRFVPAPMVLDEQGNRVPGKFDHIYTDQELYRTWNLPQKYIDVIESVIKERK